MITAALLCGGLASCSTVNSVMGRDKNKNEQTIPDAILPQDRVQIAAAHPVRSYSPGELREGIIKGDWAIETVDGKPAVGEQAPWLKFAENHRLYGNNGCNVLNGFYIYDRQDRSISFTDLASTMRLCHKEGITDTEIALALDGARSYSLSACDDGRYCLSLLDGAGNTIMTLMHQDFDFLNGTWAVRQIEGIDIDNPDIQLVFDMAEGRVHGNTGCNVLNGSVDTDMEAANSLSFHTLATTRMACPEPNYQTQLIVALEDASQAKPLSQNQTLLLDSSGHTVMVLERVVNK